MITCAFQCFFCRRPQGTTQTTGHISRTREQRCPRATRDIPTSSIFTTPYVPRHPPTSTHPPMSHNGVWKPCGPYDLLIGRVAEEIRVVSSDGNPSRWPGKDGRRSTRRDINEQDQVNYYEPCQDPKKLKHWYKILGKFLAEQVVVPDGGKPLHLNLARRGLIGIIVKVKEELCTLHAFPVGYKLFLWKHGDKDTPRIDTYLCGTPPIISSLLSTHTCSGAPHADFRSPAEFLLHAKWLAQGKPMNGGRPACGCKYCAKTKQHTITRQYIHHNPYPGRQEGEEERARPMSRQALERREARQREREREERPIMAKDYRVWNGELASS